MGEGGVREGADRVSSHSCALSTGAAPRLRDFNRASLSAIRSARSSKSGSTSIIGARAASTITTAMHASHATANHISHRHVLHCYFRRLEVNALFRALVPSGGYRCRFRSPIRYSHWPRLRRRKIVNPQTTPPEALSQITGCQAYQRCHWFAFFAAMATDALGMRHDHSPRRSRSVRVWSFMASVQRGQYDDEASASFNSAQFARTRGGVSHAANNCS